MIHTFLTLIPSVRFLKFFALTLLTCCVFSGNLVRAQFIRDTVFTLAVSATASKTYPSLKITTQRALYLNDSFSVAQTKRWIDRKIINPKTLSATLALGNNYFPEIDNLIGQHKLPPAYKWIPLCLSGMQYNFYGTDGRAGLWQLPHLVATHYKLILNHEFDQRLDPTLNTRIAVQYLSDLQASFGGDATLALLAFFNSEGSVRAVLAKTATMRFKDEAGKMNFIYGHLPASTRNDIFLWNYVAAVLDDEVPFSQVHPNGLLTSHDSVHIKNPTLIISVAHLLEIPEQEILAYNPSLRGKKIPAGVSVFLPKEKRDSLVANIDKLQLQQQQDSILQAKVVPLEKKPTAPPENTFNIMYTVRQGDNLGRIAINHQVSIRQLKEWNNLKSDRINVGQQLIIYTKEQAKIAPTLPVDISKEQKLEPGTYTEYTVKQGDSLWSISQQFPGITVEDIMRWNTIGERIDIGQVLKIKKQ